MLTNVRHLVRVEQTLDGNFKQTCGIHTANNDDIDLIGTRGLHPNTEMMKDYRARIVGQKNVSFLRYSFSSLTFYSDIYCSRQRWQGQYQNHLQ